MDNLLNCPFCGGAPEEDATGCHDFRGHEMQDYLITCKSCGACMEVCVGPSHELPCSCCHDTQSICRAKWNTRHTPKGWQLVPVEPTGSMQVAGLRQRYDEDGTRGVYDAMLAAAPKWGGE